MRVNTSIIRYAILASMLFSVVNAGGVVNGLINCEQIFSTGSGSFVGTNFSNLIGNGFVGILNIAILIVLMEFSVLSVTYAIGAGFQIDSLITFSKTELLEGVFNLIIIVAVGASAFSVYPAVTFFVNLSTISPTLALTQAPNTGVLSADMYNLYDGLCNGIDSNIIFQGFENWAGLVFNLYIANTLQSFNELVIPNGWGYGDAPFAGVALLIQLLWDDQAAYFGIMFFGMFLVVLLFIIYFLFPIFFYVGLALRAFPWTRAAGGSLIGLFFAFYVVFPGLMYPFVYSQSGSIICQGASALNNPLCHPPNFTTDSIKSLMSALINGFNFGEAYYTDVTSFVGGFFNVGLNMFGLVIALLISYEIVEKLGTILGAPSMSAQRALSRIL